jgi:uncharacterized protein YodC (DUF2158 family)
MSVRLSLFRAAALAGMMVVLPALAQQPATPAPAPVPAAPPAAVLAPAADAKVMVIGSVVQLRSGGPKMTVVELGASIATVQWHQDGAGFKKETFPIAALKLDDSSDDDEDDDEEEDDEDE